VNTGASRQAPFDAQAEAVAAGRRAYTETMQDDHWSNDAARFWDQVAVDNDRAVSDGRRGAVTATAVHVGAKVMGFFVEMSGIRQVRARAGQLGAEVGGGASGWEVTKTSAMLGGETLLAAANGLGVGGVTRAAKVTAEGVTIIRSAEAVRASEAVVGTVLRNGDDVAHVVTALAQTGDDAARVAGAAGHATQAGVTAGRAIQGMRAVSSTAARQVTRELQQLVRNLPLEGGQVTQQQARTFLNQLREVASRYGITLREGGTAGEAVGSARELVVSLKAGAAHEMVHALQMVQVRAVAFADEAMRLGTSIAEMPAAAFERANAAVIRPFEHHAYATFESMAFQATGFMGRANAATYRTALNEGLRAFGEGLSAAAAPLLREGVAARLYGELTILGRSQMEIASKIAFGAKPTYEVLDSAVTAGMERATGR
jgi:hypothetical protein